MKGKEIILKKILDSYEDTVFESPIAFELRKQINSRRVPIDVFDLEIPIPKENWMPVIGQMSTEGLNKMLASAVDQDFYEIAALIQKEIDFRKIPNP